MKDKCDRCGHVGWDLVRIEGLKRDCIWCVRFLGARIDHEFRMGREAS